MSIFRNYLICKQLIGIGMVNVSTNMAAVRLKSFSGLVEKKYRSCIVLMWCLAIAHRLELAIKDA